MLADFHVRLLDNLCGLVKKISTTPTFSKLPDSQFYWEASLDELKFMHSNKALNLCSVRPMGANENFIATAVDQPISVLYIRRERTSKRDLLCTFAF